MLLLALALVAAQADTTSIPGLQAPVEIVVDSNGIAHIYATNEHDLFFAQGYNAARDRLFQLEVWRRQATGTVAEILGPRELDRDIGTRLFMFRGDMDDELNHYHPRGRAIIEAFTEGVNAYIAEINRRADADPDALPLEFRLLGIRPEPWTPAVVISRHQGLLGNIGDELDYGRAVATAGPDRVNALADFGPGTPDIALDPDLDTDILFQDVLRPYNAYRRGVRFRPEDVVLPERRAGSEVGAGGESAAGEPAAWAVTALNRAVGPPRDRTTFDIGSNNWVVAPERMATGRAFMANDPHRAQAAPSLRYWVHLVAPGWDVIGGGEPEIPGVSIGHNGVGAWGLTVFQTDGEDLYVYETHPDDPLRYRYRGGWERMRVIVDTIPVKGRAPEIVEHRYTRHGPVTWTDPARNAAVAVRAAWLEPGGSPYLASLRMDQAKTWEEFREACTYSHIPGENMIWADTSGIIGWQAVGIAPVRPNWTGLVPVPGNGRYEWDGYLPIAQKPHAVNPPAGFIATANNELIPEGYPHRDAVGWEWSHPGRWERIAEVLASSSSHTMADMAALQTDYRSTTADDLVPLLADLTTTDPAIDEARRRLLAWDRVLDPGSVAAAIYNRWEGQLRRVMSDRFVPDDLREHLGGLPMGGIVRRLVGWDGHFESVDARDALLREALASAVADLREELGPDMARWEYGRYKHARLRHPMSRAVDDGTRDLLEVGPAPRGGNSYTVNNTGGGDNQTSGASFRILVDVGAWDRTLGSQAPGQSGDPRDPHYRDLFARWAADEFFRVPYSRPAVERMAERVTVLAPGG